MKYFAQIFVALLFASSALADSTGQPWGGGGSVTKPAGSSWEIRRYKISDGTFTYNPSTGTLIASPGSNTSAVNSPTTAHTAAFAFSVVLGYSSGGTFTGLRAWFSTPTGSPVSPPLNRNAANDGWVNPADGSEYNDDGSPKSFYHFLDIEGPEEGANIYRYAVTMVYTTGPNTGTTFFTAEYNMAAGTTFRVEDTEPYDFVINAPYTIIEPDADEDGIPDDDDPFPEDATNDGWGEEVNEDADGDGVPNWADTYPYSAGNGGDAGTASGRGANSPFNASLVLDNSDGETAATFIVTIRAADDNAVIGEQLYEVGAGEVETVQIGADEAFKVDVEKRTGQWVDGQWQVDSETYINDLQSTAQPSNTPQGQVVGDSTGKVVPTAGPAPVATSEIDGLNNVVAELRAMRNEQNQDAGEIKSKLDDLNKGDGTKAPTEPDSGGMVEAAEGIGGKLDALADAMSGLVSGLGLGGTVGSEDLEWTIQLPTGSHQISVEAYASTFSLARLAALGALSVWFVFALIRAVRGSVADGA